MALGVKLRARMLCEDSSEYEELKSYGYRMKCPAKAADLERRWCSSSLKISVADTVLRNIEELQAIGERMKHPFAGIRELFPKDYEQLRQDEIRLGFTLDNKLCLDDYVGDAVSCVDYTAEKAIAQLQSGCFTAADIYTPPELWAFPGGAFHGAQGGPC